MKNFEQTTDTASARGFYDMYPYWGPSDETNNLGQTPDTLPTAVESRERQGLVAGLGEETVRASQDVLEEV
jgi:hypothetical protein